MDDGIDDQLNEEGPCFFTHKGKQYQYSPKMSRIINSIAVLKQEGIISEKEFYILRHRYKTLAFLPSTPKEKLSDDNQNFDPVTTE